MLLNISVLESKVVADVFVRKSKLLPIIKQNKAVWSVSSVPPNVDISAQ